MLRFEFKESLSKTKNPLRHSCQDGKLVEQNREDPMFRQGSLTEVLSYKSCEELLREEMGSSMGWDEMEKADSYMKKNTL